VKTNF